MVLRLNISSDLTHCFRLNAQFEKEYIKVLQNNSEKECTEKTIGFNPDILSFHNVLLTLFNREIL